MKKLFLLLSLFIAVSCSEEKLEPQTSDSEVQGEIPSHESWNSEITFSDGGRVKAILYADHLKKYDIKRETLIDGVKIEFFDSGQKLASTLTSLRGKVDDVTRNMYAIDSVVAVNDSGTVVKTSELMWRNTDQKIVTDKFVSIKSTKEIIEGYGLESDQNLHDYVIYNITYSTTLSDRDKK